MTPAVVTTGAEHPPRVSIGVPVYNGERFLAATLRSLVSQTYRDLEIIVTDNCSTDGTEAICRAFAASDPRIRYIRQEKNLGISGNYMRGLAEARGSYFRWAAADDLSDPRLVEVCAEALDRAPDAVLAYPKTRIIDEDGQPIEDYEDNLDLPFARPSERFSELLNRLRLCNAVFGLVRTEVLRQTRGILPFVGSDIPFLAELALHGKFIEVPDRLFARRFHPAASSALQGSPLQQLFTPGRGARGTPNWDRLKALIASVARAPIPLAEKWHAARYILRTVRYERTQLAVELGARVLRHFPPQFRRRRLG